MGDCGPGGLARKGDGRRHRPAARASPRRRGIDTVGSAHAGPGRPSASAGRALPVGRCDRPRCGCPRAARQRCGDHTRGGRRRLEVGGGLRAQAGGAGGGGIPRALGGCSSRPGRAFEVIEEGPGTDVIVIGAGVVGAAIARELSRFELRCTVVEAGPDVGAGTSKANTALLHTGFDAKPGTLEARLVRRGHELLTEYPPRVGIPLEPVGALLVAWNEEQLAAFPGIVERSNANAYAAIREVDRDELYRREPHLGPGAQGALDVPDEGVICAFTPPLAYATEALASGCELRLGTVVTGVER